VESPTQSRARWLAPERITTTGVASPTEKADIWSFGLLCLEVFTGKDPYHSYSDSDLYIVGLLAQDIHPEHPESAAVGLSSEMWVLMRSCWQFVPTERPTMSGIRSTICEMLLPRDCELFSVLYWQVFTLIPTYTSIHGYPKNR
jgi:serine/threonine protein kinase